MENTTIIQVEDDIRLAWFNANDMISINTIELNSSEFLDVPDFIQFDLIKAMKLRNQLNESINDYLETIKELNENN